MAGIKQEVEIFVSSELMKELAEVKAELRAIHEVVQCIGCVTEVNASDPYTVREVKRMAMRINAMAESLGKEIWLVLDEDGEPIHCASWPSACHEHINDAINEFRIDGAEMWKVRRAELVHNDAVSGGQQERLSNDGG